MNVTIHIRFYVLGNVNKNKEQPVTKVFFPLKKSTHEHRSRKERV